MDLISTITISLIAGVTSGLNVYGDHVRDITLDLNTLYNAVFITGLIIFLDSLIYTRFHHLVVGTILMTTSFYLIRNQIFINDVEYMNGMIPQHYMGILMSKHILEKTKDPHVKQLATNIIDSQHKEIEIMKKILASHELNK